MTKSKKKTKFNLHGNYKAFIVVYHIHPGNHCKNCRISNYSGLKAPHNQFLSKRMSLISGFNQTNRKWHCHYGRKLIMELLLQTIIISNEKHWYYDLGAPSATNTRNDLFFSFAAQRNSTTVLELPKVNITSLKTCK